MTEVCEALNFRIIERHIFVDEDGGECMKCHLCANEVESDICTAAVREKEPRGIGTMYELYKRNLLLGWPPRLRSAFFRENRK